MVDVLDVEVVDVEVVVVEVLVEVVVDVVAHEPVLVITPFAAVNLYQLVPSE